MNKLYRLLGSNMGNSRQQLTKAKKYLAKQLGTILRQSSLYRTAAWGNTNQPDFLNQVIILHTNVDAPTCMKYILEIEHVLGRVRTNKNDPRIIDIDILYFNKDIISTKNLAVPHPAIPDRRFVLVPLNELSPNFIHPVLVKTNHALLLECPDSLDVKKI